MITTLQMYENDETLKNKYGPLICGVDESGRGAYAGPMVGAAVCFPENTFIEGIQDSKRLSFRRKAYLYEYITEFCLSYAISVVLPEDMDKHGMTYANRKVIVDSCKLVARDIKNFYGMSIDLFVIDNAPEVPELSPQLMVPKADDTYYCVAAASIIAKYTRDVMMIELGKQYPEYKFENNKGYISPEHLNAINEFGLLPGIHRMKCKVEGVTFNEVSLLR